MSLRNNLNPRAFVRRMPGSAGWRRLVEPRSLDRAPCFLETTLQKHLQTSLPSPPRLYHPSSKTQTVLGPHTSPLAVKCLPPRHFSTGQSTLRPHLHLLPRVAPCRSCAHPLTLRPPPLLVAKLRPLLSPGFIGSPEAAPPWVLGPAAGVGGTAHVR